MVGSVRSEANGTSGGAAIITLPDGVTALNSGGSQATWTFELPPQAHCSGDSASHGFHVFSYIVPSTTDPASLTFTSSGPSAGNPLYDTSGSPLIALNTAPVSGQVIQLPMFNWALFNVDGSAGIANPNGTYNVGIACATGTSQGDMFWNVVVTFAAKASDMNGQAWTAANSTSATTTTTTGGGATTTSSTTGGGATTTTSTTVGGTTTSTTSIGGTTTTTTTAAGADATSSTVATTTSGQLAASGGRSITWLFDFGFVLVLVGLLVAWLSAVDMGQGPTD